jgi:DNA-binding GntR family transcriptional regulator
VPSLQEEAYREIRSRIITCRFHPGATLREAEVAQALGLGRTPVRQAFDRLRVEGLVLVRPRRGVEIRNLEQRDLLEIVEARLVNEVHAAGLAALRTTQADFAALEDIVLRSAAVTAVSETALLMQLDRAFHEKLAEMSGNGVLAGILRNLQDRAIRFWFIAAGQQPQRQSVVAQHADILAALAAGDRAAAEAAMQRHIEDFRASVQRQPGLR